MRAFRILLTAILAFSGLFTAQPAHAASTFSLDFKTDHVDNSVKLDLLL
jgi:hypothetical protein